MGFLPYTTLLHMAGGAKYLAQGRAGGALSALEKTVQSFKRFYYKYTPLSYVLTNSQCYSAKYCANACKKNLLLIVLHIWGLQSISLPPHDIRYQVCTAQKYSKKN